MRHGRRIPEKGSRVQKVDCFQHGDGLKPPKIAPPLPLKWRGSRGLKPVKRWRLDAAVNIRIEWIAVHLGHRRAGTRRGRNRAMGCRRLGRAVDLERLRRVFGLAPAAERRRPARRARPRPGSRRGPDPGPGRLAGRPHRPGAGPVRRAAGAVPGQIPGVASGGGQPRPDPRGRGVAGAPAQGPTGARRGAGRTVRLDGRAGPPPAPAGALKIREVDPAPLRQSDGTRRPPARATFLGARGSDGNRPAGRSWPGDPDRFARSLYSGRMIVENGLARRYNERTPKAASTPHRGFA